MLYYHIILCIAICIWPYAYAHGSSERYRPEITRERSSENCSACSRPNDMWTHGQYFNGHLLPMAPSRQLGAVACVLCRNSKIIFSIVENIVHNLL